MSATPSSSVVYIPVRGSNPPESVSVPLTSLPSDPSDLIGVLTNELAPPSLWLRIALEYFQRGHTSSYLDLLAAITGEEATQAYSHPSLASAENRDDRIAILCSLAGYETWAGWSERGGKDGGERQHFYQLAIEHLNQATELDYTNPMTWVGKGLLLLVQGDWDDALTQFNNAIANDRAKMHALPYVGRAICCYHRGQFPQAARLFQQAITINPQLDHALMFGLALCYYQGRDTQAAVRVLQRLIDLCPDYVDALTALAIIQLNDAADTNRMRHTAGGGVQLSSSSSTSTASVQQALSLLLRAYSLNPSHPLTLIHLASHLFFQQQHAKLYTLCTRALSVLDPSQHGLRCEAHYQLARSYHAQGDFASATTAYLQAMKENEEMQKKQLAATKTPPPAPIVCSHPLVTLGYSQMLLHKGNYLAARPLLLHLHSLYPSDHDVQRLLGAVHLRLRQWKEAEELLGKAVQGSPRDVELMCEWATACEQLEGKRAVGRDAYAEAVRIIREEHGKRPPFQLLHNVGVLCQEMSEKEEAARWYQQALQVIEQEEDGKDGGDGMKGMEEEEKKEEGQKEMAVASLTTRYNLALLHEQTSPHAPLAELAAPYFALTDRFPTYVDAHLRLGTLHQSRSAHTAALHHFQTVLTQQERHLEGHTLMANLLVKRGLLKEAEKAYKKIALWTASGSAQMEGRAATTAGDGEEDEEEQFKGDTYAMLALAGLFLQQARLLDAYAAVKPKNKPLPLVLKVTKTISSEGGEESSTYWRERAGKYYRNVLSTDASNVYAAHGLGCVLAEQGEWGAAKEAMMQVREAKDGYVDVALNLGHIHVQQGQFAAAVKSYEDVIDKLLPCTGSNGDEPDDDVEERRTDAFLYLGRAYFLWGQLDEAVKALDQAVKRRGNSALGWYNRALAQEEYAIAVLRKKVEERTLDEVKRAFNRLEEAEKSFVVLERATRHQHRAAKEAKLKERSQEEKEQLQSDEEKKQLSDGAAGARPLARMSVEMSASGQLVPPSAVLLNCSTCLFAVDEKAAAHAAFCRDTLSKAAVHLRAAEAREAELARIAERTKKAKEEADERARLEREEREAKEREEVDKAEALAQQLKTKLASLQENWGSMRKADKDDDADDDGAEVAEGGEKRKRKGRKKKGRRSSGSDDGDLADEEPTGRRKRTKRRKTEEQREDAIAEEEAVEGEERGGAAAAQDEDGGGRAAEEAPEEEPEWKRMRAERSRAALAGVIPAPERDSRAGQDQTTERAMEQVLEGEDARDARRQRRLRRVEEAAEQVEEAGAGGEGATEEPQVRGLDEDDEEVEVREEEGREAETEAVVAEAVEMRRGARRKAIVEEEGEQEDEQVEVVSEEAEVMGTEGEAVQLNVVHTMENEAPIHREEEMEGEEATDPEKAAEVDHLERQTVSADTMDMQP